MASKKHGPEPGTPQAKHEGEVVKAKYGSAYFAKIGKKGGEAVKATQRLEYYAQIGKKGGAVTSERHGTEHYVRMGAKAEHKGRRPSSQPDDAP